MQDTYCDRRNEKASWLLYAIYAYTSVVDGTDTTNVLDVTHYATRENQMDRRFPRNRLLSLYCTMIFNDALTVVPDTIDVDPHTLGE